MGQDRPPRRQRATLRRTDTKWAHSPLATKSVAGARSRRERQPAPPALERARGSSPLRADRSRRRRGLPLLRARPRRCPRARARAARSSPLPPCRRRRRRRRARDRARDRGHARSRRAARRHFGGPNASQPHSLSTTRQRRPRKLLNAGARQQSRPSLSAASIAARSIPRRLVDRAPRRGGRVGETWVAVFGHSLDGAGHEWHAADTGWRGRRASAPGAPPRPAPPRGGSIASTIIEKPHARPEGIALDRRAGDGTPSLPSPAEARGGLAVFGHTLAGSGHRERRTACWPHRVSAEIRLLHRAARHGACRA